MAELDDLIGRAEELVSQGISGEGRSRLSEIITGAISLHEESLRAGSLQDAALEEANKRSVRQLKELNEHMNELERLWDERMSLVRMQTSMSAEEADGLDEREERAVERSMSPIGNMVAGGVSRANFGSATKYLTGGLKEDFDKNLSEFPEVVSEYINSLPTMLKHDRTNLTGATLGVGAAVAGLAIVAVGLNASNPVGWCILGAMVLGFGISLAIKSLKKHKEKMREREEAGLDTSTIVDDVRAGVERKVDYVIELAEEVVSKKPADFLVRSAPSAIKRAEASATRILDSDGLSVLSDGARRLMARRA